MLFAENDNLLNGEARYLIDFVQYTPQRSEVIGRELGGSRTERGRHQDTIDTVWVSNNRGIRDQTSDCVS